MIVPSLMKAVAISAILVCLMGCKTSTPSTKLTVKTTEWITQRTMSGVNLLQIPMPGIRVWGDYVEDEVMTKSSYGLSHYGGTTSSSNPNSDQVPAIYQVDNLKLPAEWNHWVQEPTICSQVSGNANITYGNVQLNYIQFEAGDFATPNNSTVTWACNMPLNTIAAASPSFALVGSIPSSITIPGQAPFQTTSGMPILYLYGGINGEPGLAATATASSVNSNGGSATFPLPSSLAASSYGLVTANAMSDGSYMPNGTNFLAVGSGQTVQGNPFGVGAQFSATTWYQWDNSDPYNDGTCAGDWVFNTGSFTDPEPVVTQYSLNSVKNGNAIIPVGSNPTAITLYDSQVNSVNQNSGPCHSYESDTTQMARAVVANSGDNTVSILDLVNNVVLSTVAVGNHPVALAVSSDGSTAYVANYGSNTVATFDLNKNSAVTTVALGGAPTSVALTNSGTLWVGGVGFLSEINTQNMTVTATETTGKTIVSLGYSNQVNQIVAVSVDSNGNVFNDQLNPAIVTAGGTYTPLHSAVVSGLGTHFNTRTQTNVRSFTNTLASTPVLNMNQPGAPPLVVYDAWVAVTATPSGFTITDIADNYQFASVSTPSPVTAIAVDLNLNVAYLTMPDSNLVWTIPLPGLGN